MNSQKHFSRFSRFPIFASKQSFHSFEFAYCRKDGALEASEPVPDEFFDVKVEDLKSIQKDLREDVRQQTQRALLPKAFVQNKNRQLKMTAYKNTVIRLAVGEHILQLLFHSAEPSKRIFKGLFEEKKADKRKVGNALTLSLFECCFL